MTSERLNAIAVPDMPVGEPERARYVIRLQTAIPKFAIFLMLVFVFEETLYGRLALNDSFYIVAKAWTEALLYLSLLVLLLHKLARGNMWQYRPTFFDYCILIFLFAALLSTLLNQGSMISALINLRTMLRYLAIYYVIVLAAWVPSRTQVTMIFKVLVGVAMLQSFLIILQHFMGDSFRDAYFSPPQMKIAVSGFAKVLDSLSYKIGSGYGTFGKTAVAAFFLLFAATVALSLALSRRAMDAKAWWIAYAIILVGIYFSYKRAPLLLALVAPILTAWFLGRKTLARRYIYTAAIALPVFVMIILSFRPDQYVKEKEVGLSPAESLAQLFSGEYWENSMNRSRGWMIMEVGRQSLVSLKPVGYGADEEKAKATLAATGSEFGRLVGFDAFDDVYIIAVLVYYGPLGVGLLIAAFFFVFRRAKMLASDHESELRLVGVCLSTILMLMTLAVFVVRLLEFRVFALLLWVFAAMTVSYYTRALDNANERGLNI